MSKVRHLRNAPIREAVIDVRTPRQEGLKIGVLKHLADSLQGYPVVQEVIEYTGELVLSQEGGVGQAHEARSVGFRAVSSDESRIVQFRRNGFTFNKLEPYTSWKEIQEEAEFHWEAYRRAVGALAPTRLALRYINNIRLPYPIEDLDDYLVGLPTPAEGWPQVVASFLVRITVVDQQRNLWAHVTRALADDVDPSKIAVIFDIDAFAEGEFDSDGEGFWGTFEALRHLKNQIFFSGVTEKTLAMHD